MWFFRRGPRILVIGAAHLDTHVNRDMDSEDLFARGFKLVHSIGGSAYNIAVNLGLSVTFRKDVVLYTVLPSEATLTQNIMEGARNANVSTEHIRRLPRFNGKPLEIGGFVALCHTDHKIRKAAADPAFNELDIFGDHLEAALLRREIGKASLVVADANLQSPDLKIVAGSCNARGIPFFVSLVSEHTSTQVGKELPFATTLISGREAEIHCLIHGATVGGKLSEQQIGALGALKTSLRDASMPMSTAIADGLTALGTTNLMCVYHDWYRLFSVQDGLAVVQDFAQPRTNFADGSALGQREAVAAALIDVCINHCSDDRMLAKADLQPEIASRIDTYVRPVLNSVGATPGSVISFKEVATPGLLTRIWRAIFAFGERARAVVAIFTILTWVAGFLLLAALLIGYLTPDEVQEKVCGRMHLPILCWYR
jgi:hypothetical protein